MTKQKRLLEFNIFLLHVTHSTNEGLKLFVSQPDFGNFKIKLTVAVWYKLSFSSIGKSVFCI